MKKMLQIIKEKDLFKRGTPNLKKIQTLTLSDIVDISTQLDQVIYSQSMTQENNYTSNFSSSLELGATSGCIEYECRLNRLDQLSRFSLMYSDKVYIGSFFSDFADYEDDKDVNVDQVQSRFYDQIRLIKYLEPLLRDGFLTMYILPNSICKDCINNELFHNRNESRVERLERQLKKDILSKLSVEAFWEDERLFCDIKKTPPYIDCGMKSNYGMPDAIMKRSRIFKRLKEGHIISLSKTLIKDLQIHESVSFEIITNILFGLLTTKKFKSSFLTDNPIHIDLMNQLNSEIKIKKKNILAQKHLTSTVPFLEEVEIKDLVKLRKNEGDAFIVYRNSLSSAIKKFMDANDSFDQDTAKEIYSDIIQPSIAKMDQRIKAVKKSMFQKVYRPAVGLIGAISFGLLSGIVPPETAAIASAASFGTCIPDMIKNVMSLGDTEDSIRNEPLYFLWKVKKIGRR